MRKIKYIVIHCSAGFGLIPSIENFWYRSKSKGGLGWKNPGYHIIIYEDGTIWYVTKDGSYSTDKSKWFPQLITNGVKGYNTESIHICYIGGVDRNNVNKAIDSRTLEQKESILYSINNSLNYLKEYQEIKDIKILGHRDFSPDKNGNGVIDSWERIKECPSFDAIKEYRWITITRENEFKSQLPK